MHHNLDDTKGQRGHSRVTKGYADSALNCFSHGYLAADSICYIDPINHTSTIRIAFFLGLVAATPLFAQQDPRIGTWTLTAAQSSLDPPNKLSVTPGQGGTVHVVMSGDKHFDFTAKANGHAAPAPGNMGFDQVQMRRIDKRQNEAKELKDGAVVATIRDKIAPSGKELTITTSTPGHPDQITVWTRSGPSTDPHNPGAGEWTEDVGLTRMRQGMPLKIEADGNGGVRFTGDYSYDARFDGKSYDLKNSRNDTVKLQLVDPHTVEAFSMRDGQVTQKDRWTVSPNGQQLTLISTGTLETGQHFNEKLTFKKQ
jgi:hypothetical protein